MANKTINENEIMNTETKTSEYLLLFRGNDWYRDLSPEELQGVMSRWKAWFDGLSAQGKLKAGQPLQAEGKVISGKKRVVTDGPFAESKEAIGGYFLLTVDTMDEAVAIARNCPGLEYGATVEVRPVADECPAAKCLKEGAPSEELVGVA